MSEEQDNSANKGGGLGGRLVFIGLILLFVYVAHFGPLLYLMQVCGLSPSGNVRRIFLTVEKPHLYVAYYSEMYFNYITWCSGDPSTSADWKHFREFMDGGGNP